jgi:uncharacterized protein (DUF1330 family)
MHRIARRVFVTGLLMSAGACVSTTRTKENTDEKPAFYIGTYDIDNPELFKEYPVRVRPLLAKYGGRVLAMDTSPFVLEGQPTKMNAIIRFPSKTAAIGLYNDPEYQEAKRIRQQSTSHCTMVLVEELPGISGSALCDYRGSSNSTA